MAKFYNIWADYSMTINSKPSYTHKHTLLPYPLSLSLYQLGPLNVFSIINTQRWYLTSVYNKFFFRPRLPRAECMLTMPCSHTRTHRYTHTHIQWKVLAFAALSEIPAGILCWAQHTRHTTNPKTQQEHSWSALCVFVCACACVCP